MKKICLLLIEAYQILCRPASGVRCRFIPSCSEYAHQAISRHGALRGIFLGLWRLLKCHPLHAAGFDPVPEAAHHG